MGSAPAHSQKSTYVTLVLLATRRPFASDEIVEGDHAHGDAVPRHLLATRMRLREVDTGNAAKNVNACGGRADEQEFVRRERPNLLDDARRRAECLERGCHAREVCGIGPDEKIEILRVARLAMEPDRPTTNHQVVSVRVG